MKAKTQFAICVQNNYYAASLELRKIYRVIPDISAAAIRQVRVIDESGEHYLYPEDYSVAVEKAARNAT